MTLSLFSSNQMKRLLFNERYLQGELQCMFKELNVSIQYDEVLKACKQLETGKSSGPDQMLNEMFMYGCKHDIFMRCLTCLFDKLLFFIL